MKRILFVDDEKNVLDGIRRMLHADRNRWELGFATSGRDALKECEVGAFDVVVSDLRMPDMDGAELLDHIRDLYPRTARIILSGNSEAALAALAFPVECCIIAKPCDPLQLRDAIDRLCALQEVPCEPASLASAYVALNNALGESDSPHLP